MEPLARSRAGRAAPTHLLPAASRVPGPVTSVVVSVSQSVPLANGRGSQAHDLASGRRWPVDC
ncbi:MAG: hypothetical protein AABZ30_00460 [Myxococcota bacterium]